MNRLKSKSSPRSGQALPKVKLTSFCKEWVMQPGSEPSRRTGWPGPTEELLIPGFCDYMTTHAIVKASTAQIYLQAMSRFFYLIEVEEGNPLAIQTLLSIYKQDLLAQMRACPLLDPKHSWTDKMCTGLSHYFKFRIFECDRQNLKSDAHKLQALHRTLEGWKKACSKNKTISSFSRHAYDSNRLENYAPIVVQKKAILQAMKDLQILRQQHFSSESIPASYRGAANTAIVGIIFLNGFAGRSGEWESMKIDQVEEMRASGRSYVVCKK